MDFAVPRSGPRRILTVLLAVGWGLSVVATPTIAASVREQQSFYIWHQQDLCAKQAFEKFPDYTPSSNRARVEATRACDNLHNVPPRADLGASPVHRIPDADAN
jgi:hypothetical protein